LAIEKLSIFQERGSTNHEDIKDDLGTAGHVVRNVNNPFGKNNGYRPNIFFLPSARKLRHWHISKLI